MPYFPQVLKFALYLALSSSLVSGFSFTFTSQPQQCSNLSLQITGSGTPPYSVLIIPYGPTPLPNNIEARTIVYQEFSGDSSSVSFQLKYPTSSQFVAVVSDLFHFGIYRCSMRDGRPSGVVLVHYIAEIHTTCSH
jgi:hypothetical protein